MLLVDINWKQFELLVLMHLMNRIFKKSHFSEYDDRIRGKSGDSSYPLNKKMW